MICSIIRNEFPVFFFLGGGGGSKTAIGVWIMIKIKLFNCLRGMALSPPPPSHNIYYTLTILATELATLAVTAASSWSSSVIISLTLSLQGDLTISVGELPVGVGFGSLVDMDKERD